MTSEPAIPDELVRETAAELAERLAECAPYHNGPFRSACLCGWVSDEYPYRAHLAGLIELRLAAVLAVAGHSDTELPKERARLALDELMNLAELRAVSDDELDELASLYGVISVPLRAGVVGVPVAQPANDEAKPCPECNGRGLIDVLFSYGVQSQTCDVCGGSGTAQDTTEQP